jgi:hypothetical protein
MGLLKTVKSNSSLPALALGLMLLLVFGSIARAEDSLICRSPAGTAAVTIHSIDGVDYLFLNELVERTGLSIGWDVLLNRLTLLRDGQERVVALVDSPLYRVREVISINATPRIPSERSLFAP